VLAGKRQRPSITMLCWIIFMVLLRVAGVSANYDYATASRLSRIGPSTFLLSVSYLLSASSAFSFSRLVRISPAEIFPSFRA
jgi:hypothetical protein